MEAKLSGPRSVLCHVQFFAIPRTVACQTPLSMGFSGTNTSVNMPFPPKDAAFPALAGGFFPH